MDNETLTLYLESAHSACLAYAPPLAGLAPVSIALPAVTPYSQYLVTPSYTYVQVPMTGAVSGALTFTRTGDIVQVEGSVTYQFGAFGTRPANAIAGNPSVYVADWDNTIPDAFMPLEDESFIGLSQGTLNVWDGQLAFQPPYQANNIASTTKPVKAVWYATPLATNPEGLVPEAYKLAEIMQARNIWNAIKASSGGDMDGSGFGISVMPLDWSVKQLLRPDIAHGGVA